MRKTNRRPRWEQLELFLPTPKRPTWKMLPQEVCRKILPLLARLLRSVRRPNGTAAKEVDDER